MSEKIFKRVSRSVPYSLCLFYDYLTTFFCSFSKEMYSEEILKRYDALLEQVYLEKGYLDCDELVDCGDLVIEEGIIYE